MASRVGATGRPLLLLLLLSACSDDVRSADGGTAADAAGTSDGGVDTIGRADVGGWPDADATSDTPSRSDAGPATEGECDRRDERTCEADMRCAAIRGGPPDLYCAKDSSQWAKIYAGCMPANRVCGQAITWATDPRTGQTLVFPCTAIPLWWRRIPFEQCPWPDGGVDARDH